MEQEPCERMDGKKLMFGEGAVKIDFSFEYPANSNVANILQTIKVGVGSECTNVTQQINCVYEPHEIDLLIEFLKRARRLG